MEDIFGCLHRPQYESAKQTGDDGHYDRHDSRQFQTDRHIAPHCHIIVCSEFLGHRNTEATAASITESQYQKHDRCTGTHRSQSIDTQKFSNDSGIYQRIRLLKQIAEQQR